MRLRTERLILRDFEPADLAAMLEYQRDPRYLRYYPPESRAEAAAEERLRRFLAWQTEEPRFRFQLAITPGDGGAPIGNVGLRLARPGARVAELGYELSPEHWGRGYATEAATALLDFGFAELALHRVHAHGIAGNEGSRRVLSRLGMREEGRLRDAEHFSGRWWDVLLFGILEEEWRARADEPITGPTVPVAREGMGEAR